MPGKMTSQIPLLRCQITARGPHKGENTKSHSANTVSGDARRLFFPARESLPSKYQGLSRELQGRKKLRSISYLQWSEQMPKKHQSWDRAEAVWEGPRCKWTGSFGTVWGTAFCSYISFRFEHSSFGSPSDEGGGGTKEWICPEWKQLEAGGCLETAQTIVLTFVWADDFPSAHNQKDAVFSVAWRNQQGWYTAPCLVSLINNNSSCLAVAAGQDRWGDFDQSLSMSWEGIGSVCTLFSLGLSLHMDSLWFGMERAWLAGAIALVS